MPISTIFAFVFALGLLVTIHELGHYLVARWCDVKILRFSIGMGKVIFSRRYGKDQTEWVISILPLGGYVKMLDARDSDVLEQDQQREFTSKSVWKRIAIVAAGPIANFLLAIFLFTTLYLNGLPDATSKIRLASEHSFAYQYGLRHGDVIRSIDGKEIQSWSELRNALLENTLDKKDVVVVVSRLDVHLANLQNSVKNSEQNTQQNVRTHLLDIKLPLSRIVSEQLNADFLTNIGIGIARPAPILKEVVKDGPAFKAGLQAGDQIIKIEDVPVIDSQALSEIISASPNKPLFVLVKSADKEFSVELTPELVKQNEKEIGRIQVQLDLTPELISVSLSPWQAVLSAVQKTWETSLQTFSMIAKMVTGDVSIKNITGPITIADYAGQTARIGFVSYISFIALISISLGVMNLLPIPVLDGGHLLYYSLEVLTGKPIPEKYIAMTQRAGIAMLVCLMAVAFFNDIVRLMS